MKKEDNRLDLTDVNGFILIDKKSGITSYDIIRDLKKEFKTSKIGHTGTLDPLTTGILAVALGRATKLIDFISKNSKKTYIATMKIGISTDTLDIDGKVLEKSNDDLEKFRKLQDSEIKNIFALFKGKQKQLPPKYSAKKINGKRAYDLARENKEVILQENNIEIYELNILDIDKKNGEIKFEVIVSKGTYIRSLILDISKKMNLLATMSNLRRTQTDGFSINQASNSNNITVSDIITLDQYFLNLNFKKYEIDNSEELKLFSNGVKVKNSTIVNKFMENQLFIVYDNNKAISLYKRENDFLKQILKIKI